MAGSNQTHVFLSYSEDNEAFVEALARRLKDDARVSFWFRPWHAIPGRDIQTQMEEALYNAQSCAVFLGAGGLEGLLDEQMQAEIQALMDKAPGETPSHDILLGADKLEGSEHEQLRSIVQALGDKTPGQAQSYTVHFDSGELRGWQNEQMRAAIQARVEDDPTYRIIPVLLPGTTRPNRRDLPRFLRLYEPVEFRSSDDERAFKCLLSGILGIPPIEVEGFLEARNVPATDELPAAPVDRAELAAGAMPFEPQRVRPVEPSEYNLAVIRDLLIEAFDADDFRQIFYFSDNPKLKPVYKLLGPNDNLPNMAMQAITYCERHRGLPDLLDEVKRANPYQYDLFQDRLRHTTQPAPAEPADEARQFEPAHVNPDNPPIAAIRRLLLAVFQPELLRRFCQERRDFRPIVSQFGPGHGLEEMVDKVIDYCSNYLLWDVLLDEVARLNPAQYARFEPQLRQT
jgi:TIR domain